jgi:hypothetical protein
LCRSRNLVSLNGLASDGRGERAPRPVYREVSHSFDAVASWPPRGQHDERPGSRVASD